MLALRTLLTVVISLAACRRGRPAEADRPSRAEGPGSLVQRQGPDRLGRRHAALVRQGRRHPRRDHQGEAQPRATPSSSGRKPATLGDFELRLSFRIERRQLGRAVPQQAPALQGRPTKTSGSSPATRPRSRTRRARPASSTTSVAAATCARSARRSRSATDGKPKVVGKLGDKAAIGSTLQEGRLERLRHHRQGQSPGPLPQRHPDRGRDRQRSRRAALMSGILALQIHAGPPMVVEFKDVRLKRFEESKP